MKIRNVIGWLLVAAGIVLMVWLALWVMFVGGIVQIVDGVKAMPTNGWDIAWGIVKIVFSECGVIPGILVSSVGLYLADD